MEKKDCWISAFLLISISAPASAEWFSSTSAGFQYDSNITNAILSSNIVSDTAFTASAKSGYVFDLDNGNSASIQGELKGESYDKFHGLNNISAGVNLALRRKWGLGLYAPWTSLSGSATRLNFSNEARNGWLYRTEIGGGKRITERWNTWANVSLEKRTGDHAIVVDNGVSGAAFDLTNTVVKLGAEYAFDQKTTLAIGYSLRHGDVVSTILRDSAGDNWDTVTTAVTWDPAFGPAAEAYRITGTTHSLNFHLVRELATNILLGAEYQRQVTHGASQNDYYKHLFALTFSYGF